MRNIFLLCLLAQMASAQHTSFCSGVEKKNYRGAFFTNPDSIPFFDESVGSIKKWVWNFDGANVPMIEYTKFNSVVYAKWTKAGRYKVKLTTFDTHGNYSTLEVRIDIEFIDNKPQRKKERKEYLSLFAVPTAEYLFSTQQGNSNETFLGASSGIIISPHSKWTSDITLGYFWERNIKAPETFSGLYINMSVPIVADRFVLGPEFRVGRYTNGSYRGFSKALGINVGYLTKKTLTPKGPIDLKIKITGSVGAFGNSDVSICSRIYLVAMLR